MIYAVSDLHGCYDKYQKLLETLNLGENDTLFVLGDVIDRGPNGFQIMLDIASRPNVVCLMGNHEAMAKDALPAIWDSLESRNRFLNLRGRENVSLWFHNGGKISVQDFLWLDKPQKDLWYDSFEPLGFPPLYCDRLVNFHSTGALLACLFLISFCELDYTLSRSVFSYMVTGRRPRLTGAVSVSWHFVVFQRVKAHSTVVKS